jgi:hypothetical protein
MSKMSKLSKKSKKGATANKPIRFGVDTDDESEDEERNEVIARDDEIRELNA